MNLYKPGQSMRFSVAFTVFGVPTNPTSVTCTVYDPTGGAYALTPVNDSAGNYHADFTIPNPLAAALLGGWISRWVATGATDPSNGLGEEQFAVQPLLPPT